MNVDAWKRLGIVSFTIVIRIWAERVQRSNSPSHLDTRGLRHTSPRVHTQARVTPAQAPLPPVMRSLEGASDLSLCYFVWSLGD